MGLEVVLVALGLEGHQCPQNGGHWWDWGWRDVGVPKVGDIGGIGLEGHWWHWVRRDFGVPKMGTFGVTGLEVTLVALGLK